MTVLHLSLLDLVGQSTATPVTATAGDWQHFQDLLKSALDQNAPADTVKPTAPERQAAGASQESNPDSPTDSANTAKANAVQTAAAQADAAAANATQAKSAAAARHIEKRIAARADAASADRKAAPQASSASATTTDTPAVSDSATPAAATADSGSAPGPASAVKIVKDANAGDTGPVPVPTATMTQDPGTPVAPVPSDPPPASADTKAETARKSAPDPTAATTPAMVTTDAAAAPVIAVLVPAYPLPSPAPAVADGGPSSITPDPVATGGLADLLASTTDPMLGDHLAAETSRSASRGAKPADSQATDPASTLFGSGGDSAASLAAGIAPVPPAQSENRSAGRDNSQQQSRGSSQGASDQTRNDRSGDPQAAPAQNAVPPSPTPAQVAVVPSALLGAPLAGSGAERSAAITADSDIDPAGATPGLGLGERASAASLTPLRLSETPNSTSSPYAATQAPLPVEQVALAIGRLTNGARSFSMQLNPEHLGAVDVRMEVDAKGKTKVAITAERPETLALLKLDSHHLVKALQDSGVSADQASLSFSLREQGSNASGDRRTGSGPSGRTAGQTLTDDTQNAEAAPVRMSLSRHLYDIHA